MICDVGGQDIKLIILKNGQVKDFKLNTQCSAGNGYFLQSHGRGLRLLGRGVRGHRVLRRDDADLRLRLRRVHAVRHRRLPAPGLAAAGDHGRAGGGAAEEHLALRLADPEPGVAGHELRAAGRHPAQPRGGEVAGRLHRVALRRQGRHGPTSSCTSTAASRARSAPPSRRSASGRTGARRSSSAWTACATSRSSRTATRTRAATSARTSACAPSSTSTVGGLGDRRLRAAVEDPAQAGRAAPDRRQLVRARPRRGRRRDAGDQEGDGLATRRPTPTSSQIAAEAVWRSMSPPNVADPPAKRAFTNGAEGAQRGCWRSARSSASASRGCSTSTRSTRSSRPTSRASGIPPQNLVYSGFTIRGALQGGRQARRHRPLLPVARSGSRTCTT